jgi:hypothetical protein
MQQTKRRSKKGVILLALAFALLVLAIVPMSAFAASTGGTGNMKITPSPTSSLNVSVHMNVLGTAGAQINGYRVTVNGGTEGVLIPIAPATGAWVADLAVTLKDIADGSQSISIRVFDSADLTVGTIYTNNVFLIRTTPISTVVFTPPGILGDDDTYWTNSSSVSGTFGESTGVLMGSTLYKVSPSGLTGNLNWLPAGGTTAAQAPVTLVRSTDPDGIYTVEHWAVSYTGVRQYMAFPSVDSIGKDTEDAHVTASGIDSLWHSTDIKASFTVDDPGGSGVASASAQVYNADGTMNGAAIAFKPGVYPFSPYVFTGAVTIPAVLATQSHPYVVVYTEDVAGNIRSYRFYANIDVQPPSTVVQSVTPAGAASDPLMIIGPWTNTDVVMTLLAIDQGGNGSAFDNTPGSPFVGKNAGVDYTEYITGSSTSTAPALSASGTKVDPLTMKITITNTAPTGPVYVWYRSVDKATPPNFEKWNLVYVWIDKIAPTLSDNTPSWWINQTIKITNNDGMGVDSAGIILRATDANSLIAPPGITWAIPGHPPLGGTGVGDYVEISWVQVIAGLADGIHPLTYSASDKAGNFAEKTVDIKIDTRPPVTDAAKSPVTDGATNWINGLEPYVLTATDQAGGAGVAATLYRVFPATPWTVNASTVPTATLDSSIAWVSPTQGQQKTIDFVSVDASLPFGYVPVTGVPSWHFGNWELNAKISVSGLLPSVSLFKTRNVKLDVTAPVVTAMDPKLGEWQKGPAVVNFSGTDVGAGYAYTEWSTDGGTTWTKGEVATIGGNGETTVTYRGVDKVGIKSANQTIVVKVASTRPSVTGGNVSVGKGHKATFTFNVTAVTPTATSVVIEIRSKATGHTFITKRFANVTTNSDQTRSFKINLKKGKYNIRISATDAAGNVQAKRGGGTLTVR